MSDGRPTIHKLRRDGLQIKKQARWVFVIDERGELIDFINNDHYIANVIAVLGPTSTAFGCVTEAVLLEIGISRGRPYRQAESQKLGGRTRREHIKPRVRSARLSFEQLKILWPSIQNIIEQSIIDARENWSLKGAWAILIYGKRRLFERGVFFTISRDDPELHEAFMLRDVDVRTYLRRNAFLIEYFLRRFKFVHYPEKQLKSYAGVHAVVDLWRNLASSPRWSPRYARRILSLLRPSKRSLFEFIADVYSLDLGNNHERDRVLEKQARELPFHKHLRARIVEKGSHHGKGCDTFEVFFTREYRETMNV